MRLKRFLAALLINLCTGFGLVADARFAGTSVNALPAVNWSGGVAYDYDGSGNVTQIGEDTFVYDHVGRLVEAKVNDITREYTYDAFGNRTDCTNQPGMSEMGDCQQGMRIDSKSNRVQDVEYDDRGNVRQLFGHTYSWDSINMQTRDERANGIAREYIYTANDERIATYIVGTRWDWTVRDLEGRVLRQFNSFDGAAVRGTASWTWTRDNVYRDGLLLASRHVRDGASVTYHYHLDRLGSARRVSDHNALLVGIHDYLSFGTEISGALTEPEAGSIQYTGHERDKWFGAESYDTLDYMRARFYSPTLGRFLSTDSGNDWDRHAPQSWNQYAYVRNSPVNATDPTGRWIELADVKNRAMVRTFLVRTVMRPTGRAIVASIGQSTTFGVRIADHRINPPVSFSIRRMPGAAPPIGGTFTPDWTRDAAFKITGASGGSMKIDTLAISKVHPDRSGVSTIAHEFYHATGAQQGLSPAELKAQDDSGSAGRFGAGVSAEDPDITEAEAEAIVDDLLSGNYKPTPRPAGACIEGPTCQ